MKDMPRHITPNDVIDHGFFEENTGSTLILACGALARDILQIIEINRLTHLDVKCLPAKLHHTPEAIPEAVRKKIRENRNSYTKIFIVYGDCGTGGALDQVLEEEGGIERIPGPHCFSFYWGNDAFSRYGEDEIRAFYITDFFCKHFEKFMWEAYGLDRHESMVEFVFGNYEKLIYMAQVADAGLEKGREIAQKLKLKYEYRLVGYGDLGSTMLNIKGVD